MLNFNHLFGPAQEPSRQIPPRFLANEFGEVSVRRVGDTLQVGAALAMGAFVIGDGERCQVGLALDASDSMRDNYGRGSRLTSAESQSFIAAGKFKVIERDGVSKKVLTSEAREEALRLGMGQPTPNIVRDSAVSLIQNLIRTFATGGAAKGTCEVIYWACGADGRGLESAGGIGMDTLPGFPADGPKHQKFGLHTHLTPALNHFLKLLDQSSGVFAFVTDGRIDDEAEVVQRTHHLARAMRDGKSPPVKCVLIGVGKKVDTEQFGRIDDMDMPGDVADIDIWNSKVFADMRDITDAWSEIFDPNAVIASRATVTDMRGEVLKEWTDQVTALLTFTMPASSKGFVLDVEGMRIERILTME